MKVSPSLKNHAWRISQLSAHICFMLKFWSNLSFPRTQLLSLRDRKIRAPPRAPSSRPCWPLLAVALTLLLTGCAEGNTAANVAPILKVLVGSAALATLRSRAGSAAVHFMEQRVAYLIGKNSGWASESNYASLTARLASEMGQIADLVDDRTTALSGADTTVPQHRDLQDAAKHLTTSGAAAVTAKFQQYVADRKQRIAQIAWRAGAVQHKLWGADDSTLQPQLQKTSLVEMLDRRLHSVEMLILHDEGELGTWSVANATAGWKDQQRTSMFQYPWVRFGDNAGFQQALTNAGLTVAGLAPAWTVGSDEIDFDLRVRLRPEAALDWTWDDAKYVLTLSAASASTAFDHLIPPSPKTDPAFEDFFERNWVFCDIMLAALHLQALRFSRLRRTTKDDDFNTAAGAGVTLRPLIPGAGPPAANVLMARGADWFDGVAIPHEELQVGDHLIFWNNQFVRFILGSAFGLENSFVTRVTANGKGVMLAGHGMPETEERKFAEEMAEEMKRSYATLAGKISQQAQPAPPVLGFHANNGRRFQVVNWAPFGELFGAQAGASVNLPVDGAWWIRLKLETLRDAGGPVPSMQDALAMIPKSVRVDLPRMTPPTLPAGDFQPNYQEAIYLPLSVPAGVNGGWTTYLAHPKGLGDPVDLVDLIPDGDMVPGFFLKGQGQDSKIPVLRPKVQP